MILGQGYNRFLRRLLRRGFGNAMQEARHLSTAGEAMEKAYEKEYDIHSVVLRHGFDTSFLPQERCQKNKTSWRGFPTHGFGPWVKEEQ